MGYDESESKILSTLLKNKLLTAEEIEEKSGVSKSKVYQVLKGMEEKGFTSKNDYRPAAYFVTNKFIETIESTMKQIYQDFIGKLESVRLSTKKESFEDILDIFKKKGYVITEAQHLSKQIASPFVFFPEYFQTGTFFDFIAEGDFKLAIAFIDKGKEKFCENIIREEMFRYFVHQMSQQLECVSFCLFISPEITISNKFYEFAKEELKVPITSALLPYMEDEEEEVYPRFIGIEDLPPKVILLQGKVEEDILFFLNSLRNRRDTTDRLIKDLNDSVESIDLKIGEVELIFRHIPRTLEKPPFFFKKNQKDFINKIKKPVINIVNRENVNLKNLKKFYLKEKVRANEYLDLVDRRFYYPSANTLDKVINTLNRIRNITDAIHFEIRTLDRELTTVLRNVSVSHEEVINPFIFTIPFEEEDFIINQENAKLAIREYIGTIKSDDHQIYSKFIFGKDGIGKTHLIKYFAIPEALSRGLLPIFITCPLSHDLIRSLSESLLSLELYPDKMQTEIKLLQEWKYQTQRDILNLFERINDISISHGYAGTLICIDELENTLPYFLLEGEKTTRTKYAPLSLRELNAILDSDTLMRLGLLIASRDNIIDLFKEYMTKVDFETDIIQPQPLSSTDVKKLIEHRYELWNTEKLIFDAKVINKIVEKSGGNARIIVKLCRDIHAMKMAEKRRIAEKRKGQTFLDEMEKERSEIRFTPEITIEELEAIAKKYQ